jgi:hypothetical protein
MVRETTLQVDDLIYERRKYKSFVSLGGRFSQKAGSGYGPA